LRRKASGLRLESRKTINRKLTNRLNFPHGDRVMRRIQSSGHHHSLSFILLCRGLIIQHPLLVRDALPIAAIPKAPTDGDCSERLPAAIPSPKSRTRSPELRRREEREDLATKYTREQAPRESREEISVKIRSKGPKTVHTRF